MRFSDERKALLMHNLLSAWMKQPAYRLGQFLENLVPHEDFFYIEDSVLEKAVIELLENYNEDSE